MPYCCINEVATCLHVLLGISNRLRALFMIACWHWHLKLQSNPDLLTSYPNWLSVTGLKEEINSRYAEYFVLEKKKDLDGLAAMYTLTIVCYPGTR